MPAVQSKTQQEDDVDPVLRFGFRLACSSALYPLEYAKTLIQLGYEPIAPRPGRTLFGARRLMLPNIFQYAAYIKSVDGFTGCFRGLSARLAGNILSSYYGDRLAMVVMGCFSSECSTGSHPAEEIDFVWDNITYEFVDEYMARPAAVPRGPVAVPSGLMYKAVRHCCGVIISHPFHVISIRMMAQFIGREHMYDGLFGSIKEIWAREGISGFFSGLVPRLWMDFCVFTLTGVVTYLFAKYVGGNKTIRGHVNTITHFTVSSILYPYHVVSTCMAVQGSRLQAGNPPMMDHYINWRDCYARLRLDGEHKRGSSFFFRTIVRVPAKVSNAFVPLPEMK
uniref:Mitochondrial carrier n=1 Tax=Anopheles dirus TaxID=7168 RepID=A0A182N987_9DIPT